ncbi:MAG: dTDP-4-dehydrorhamnose reductase [Bacteroidales bacterium]|jgi:dTDP-4-dehydrorhamnose reductase
MNILVTGGDGQLGSSLKKFSNEHKDHIFTFIDVKDLDLTDTPAMVAYINKHNPDIIINCAAYTAVDKAESEPEKAMAINAAVPGELAKICEKAGIRLLHISTDYVFDGKSYTPYKETDPVNPVSLYAKSKQEGEKLILEQNVKGVIIRTSWLYSEYGQNFIKTILKRGKEQERLRVVYDQVGGPTYAGDLAKAILEILPAIAKTDTMDIYHYANEGIISWYDFASAIVELSGIECVLEPIETKDYPTLTARPAFSAFNKNKFKSHFGMNIPYWRSSLKTCIINLKEI